MLHPVTDQDNRIRSSALQELYGYGHISKDALESVYGIEFDTYFASELTRLSSLEAEGIVTTGKEAIRVTRPLGQLLVRVVAVIFDNYLPKDAYKNGMAPGIASTL